MADTTDGATDADEQPRDAAIRAGMAVYDAQDARIGNVENTEPEKGYFEAKTGGVFSRDLYIPLDAVARVETAGIHLKVAKRDLDTLDWYLPPTNGVDMDTPYSSSPGIETGYGQEEQSVPVVEEHLEAQTHRKPDGAGTAHVRKVVHSEQRSLEVPVTHDELRVVRVPTTDETASRTLGPDVFTEKDIDVPLMGEQVELATRTRVTEEVVLRKRQVTQQRTYSGEVRQERIWVEGPGGDEITSSSGDTAVPGAGERDISDQDTIAYDRFAEGQEGPEAYRQ